MALLKQQEIDEITQAIAEIEKQTDAELVAVLARQSDEYLYIPMLWAALMALFVPVLPLLGLNISYQEVLLLQVLLFVGLSLAFRMPAISVRLIPQTILKKRASQLARSQFLDNNLHHTKGETGVLLFISEAEHYVEILADRGINNVVAEGTWQSIVDCLVDAIAANKAKEGLLKAIESCGALLAEKAPATEAKNELPNHLIVL